MIIRSGFKSNKVDKENTILTFLLIFTSSYGSVVAWSSVTLIFSLIYAYYIFNKRNLIIDTFIIVFTLVFVIITLIYYLKFGWVDYLRTGYYYLKILYAYFTIKCLRINFFEKYERIIYILAIVSLPLYLLQLLAYDELFNIIGYLQQKISFLEFRNDVYANSFFFTINGYGPYRNSGFAWEPKGFANFLVLAIIFNLIRNKFKFNKRLIVYLIAILTTLSTTGFLVVFFVLPFLFFYNIKKHYLFLVLPLGVLANVYILQLDFMEKKISSEISRRNDYISILRDNRAFGARSLTRMGSLIVDLNDFYKQPIFGYGMQKDERTQNRYSYLVRVNGLSDRLVTFGVVGFMFFIITLYLGFKKLFLFNNIKGVFIILIAFAIIDFASTIHPHPLWIAMHFLFLIEYNYKKLYNKNIKLK